METAEKINTEHQPKDKIAKTYRNNIFSISRHEAPLTT